MKYRKHIFICTNQKASGKACCGEERGMALVEAFRTELKAQGIKDVRAQRAGCLDLCAFGPAAMVYPDGTCYGHLEPEDAARIVNEHILCGQEVMDKRLDF